MPRMTTSTTRKLKSISHNRAQLRACQHVSAQLKVRNARYMDACRKDEAASIADSGSETPDAVETSTSVEGSTARPLAYSAIAT